MNELVANGILDAIGRLPGWLAMGCFWYKTFDVRGKRWFWVAWMLLYAVQSVRIPYIGGATGEAIFWSVLQMFVFPLVFSRGKLWYRIIVVASTAVVVVMSELTVGLVLLRMLSDITTFRDVLDHPAEYFLCQLMVAFIFALSFLMLHVLFMRLAHQRNTPAFMQFGAGMLAQLGVTCGMAVLPQYYVQGNAALYITSCVYAVVNIGADALILASILRANAAYEQRAHAERLRVRLDGTLAHFKNLADEIYRIARFRHDLRDELQSVAALVRAGDFARAEALVGELERQVHGEVAP